MTRNDAPNVLFLPIGQQRVGALQQYGNRVIATPALDRIAASGVVMYRFFTPTAIGHFVFAKRRNRNEDFKLVFNPESGNELDDLQLDPHELRNVYEMPRYWSDLGALEVRLHRELIERGDPAGTWMSYMSQVGSNRAADADGMADPL